MNCAWDAYLNLIPVWLRPFVDKRGKKELQELRLRRGQPPELVLKNESCWGNGTIRQEDISYCINAASRYSPWSAVTSAYGYITAQGGHRVGICGEATNKNGVMTGIAKPHYLCLRVARDFWGIAESIAQLRGSILIIGPPGSGKTTLLRDLIRATSDGQQGSIAVVDERGELFPVTGDGPCFCAGRRTDILCGCSKVQGVEAVLRTMGPSVIAVDEITSPEDCKALLEAGWCGVKLLATAHARDAGDLRGRAIYRPLAESGLFEHLVVLQKDKSWSTERMWQCTANG